MMRATTDFSPQRRRLLAAGVAAALGGALRLPAAFAVTPATATRTPTLMALTRTLFPLAVFGDAQHAAAAAKIDERCAADPALNALVDRALAALPGDWLDATPAVREATLRSDGDPALIKLARQCAVGPLFGDPATWPAFDYPGPSLAFGGYLDRQLVDLPWLTEAST